jgi:antirestriction protein ArdC
MVPQRNKSMRIIPKRRDFAMANRKKSRETRKINIFYLWKTSQARGYTRRVVLTARQEIAE